MDPYFVKDMCHHLQEILSERSRRRGTLASDSCLIIRLREPIQIQLRSGRLLFKENDELKGLSKDEWVDADGNLWICKVSFPKRTAIRFNDAVISTEQSVEKK